MDWSGSGTAVGPGLGGFGEGCLPGGFGCCWDTEAVSTDGGGTDGGGGMSGLVGEGALMYGKDGTVVSLTLVGAVENSTCGGGWIGVLVDWSLGATLDGGAREVSEGY